MLSLKKIDSLERNSEKEAEALIKAMDFQKLRITKNPVLNFDNIRNRRSFEYEIPEYDFAEIDRVLDIESYAKEAVKKKGALAIKEGWFLNGTNPQYVEYVNTRLNQIAWASNITKDQLVDRILSDLIRYSNCCLAVVRDVKSSGGRPYVDSRTGKKVKPIAGLFPIPMSTLEIKFNDFGHITGYRQSLPNKRHQFKEFPKANVLHFIVNQKGGYSVGTPCITPGVIEDIKALRRIEENVEMLTIQNLFPLVHYKVGTPELPARMNSNGISEIDAVMSEISAKPPEGIYVTSERHDIKMIGTEGRALRVEAYLEYFKGRVLAGLGLSNIDVGDGSGGSRSTAETMSRSMVDEVKSIQRRLEDMFHQQVIVPLMLEAAREIDLTVDENLVHLRFNEIDIDAQIKKENHSIQKYTGNVITVNEARAEMGLNRLNLDEWDESFYKLVTEPQELIRAGSTPDSPLSYAAANSPLTSLEPDDIAKAEAARRSMAKEAAAQKAAAKPAASASSKPNKSASNKAVPKNQHSSALLDYSMMDSAPGKLMHNLRTMLTETDKLRESRIAIKLVKGEALKKMVRVTRDGFDRGLYLSGLPSREFSQDSILSEKSRTRSRGQRYVERLFRELEDYSQRKTATVDKIVDKLDSIQYRLSFIERTEGMKSQNWGTVVGLRFMGEEKYNIDIKDDTHPDEVLMAQKDFLVQEATLANIPPHHPNSTIQIIRFKGDNA